MELPNEIHYDCVSYNKSVRFVNLDGHKRCIVRYDSDFGTCLCHEIGLYQNDTEFALRKRLEDAKIL